jgi:hypothetical protein
MQKLSWLALPFLLSGCVGPGEIGDDTGDENALAQVDADGDGLDDGLELSLALKFAPQVRLHPQEWALPANVDWYLARVSMRFDHGDVCNDHQVMAQGTLTQPNLSLQHHPTDNFLCIHTSTIDPSNVSHGEFFLTPSDAATHDGIKDPTQWKVYVHARPSKLVAGGVDLQYWLFYAYNPVTLNFNHEGDWDHVTISLDGKHNFVSAWYAQHNTGTRYEPSQLSFVDGTHLIVYAALGTHESYPHAGDFPVPNNVITDHTADGGLVWNTAATLINVGERGHPLANQTFIEYGGRWGRVGYFSFTSGPQTPPFQSSWDSF